MEDHEKNMKVLANVQIFEQYRRIVEEFKVGIENQNTAIENQTNAAALGAGFLKLGSTFVKKGAISSAVGVVNAYSWYDTDTAIASGLTESGFTSLTGNSLTNYLETKDQVEVDAFFYTQKLAVQTVFEKIMGKGTEAERKGSQDERVIGTFAKWAGRGPGSEDQSTLEGLNDAARSHGVQLKPQESQLLAAVGGFGELGEFGTRPGGAAMGFYLQMQLMGANVSQGDAGVLAGMGGVDPLTTMVNQYNPVTMMANSTMNVRIAAATMGKDEGYMWEAQAINLLKAPITLAGSGFMMAGVAAMVSGIGFVGGAIMAAGGLALSALGNSISVNPTTGERITKMTDQAAMNTGIAAVTSILGGAAQGFKGLEAMAKTAEAAKAMAQTAQMAQTMATVAGVAGTALSAGTRFDANGNSQGWTATSHNGDMHGEQLLLATGVSAATAAASSSLTGKGGIFENSTNLQKALLNDMVSTGLNVTAQYGAQQTWGAQHSSYGAMAHADLGRLGGLGFNLGMAGYADAQIEDAQRRQNDGTNLPSVPSPAKKGLLDIFAGFAGARRQEDGSYDGFLGGLESIGNAIGSGLDYLHGVATWALPGLFGDPEGGRSINPFTGEVQEWEVAPPTPARSDLQEWMPEGELIVDGQHTFIRDKDGTLWPIVPGAKSAKEAFSKFIFGQVNDASFTQSQRVFGNNADKFWEGYNDGTGAGIGSGFGRASRGALNLAGNLFWHAPHYVENPAEKIEIRIQRQQAEEMARRLEGKPTPYQLGYYMGHDDGEFVGEVGQIAMDLFIAKKVKPGMFKFGAKLLKNGYKEIRVGSNAARSILGHADETGGAIVHVDDLSSELQELWKDATAGAGPGRGRAGEDFLGKLAGDVEGRNPLRRVSRSHLEEALKKLDIEGLDIMSNRRFVDLITAGRSNSKVLSEVKNYAGEVAT